MDTVSVDAVEVFVFEPISNCASLLQSGDIPGDEAGHLLEVLIAGCREKLKGGE